MKATVTLASALTPDGTALTLHEHDGQFFLKVDGLQLMSTTAWSSEEKMAELACATLPKNPHILIGGLGFGFTLKRVLELTGPDARVVVSELIPKIVQWNREFLAGVNGRLLDDPRVKTLVSDVYDIIDRGASAPYDTILLDVDNGPDPFVQKGNGRLYQHPGLARIKAALNPGGRVVFWSANEDKAFVKTLSKSFRNVETVGAKAYPSAKRFTHTLFVADRD